jgi:hypothetical protein
MTTTATTTAEFLEKLPDPTTGGNVPGRLRFNLAESVFTVFSVRQSNAGWHEQHCLFRKFATGNGNTGG